MNNYITKICGLLLTGSIIATFVGMKFIYYATVLVVLLALICLESFREDVCSNIIPVLSFLPLLFSELVTGDIERILSGIAELIGWLTAYYLGRNLFIVLKDKSYIAIKKELLLIGIIGILFSFVFEIIGDGEIILQTQGYINFIRNSSGELEMRVQSFFGHPIVFSQMLLITAWVSLSVVNRPWVKAGIVLASIALILMSGSRSAWGSTIVCILVYSAYGYIVRGRSNRIFSKRLVLIVCSILVISLIILSINWTIFSEIIQRTILYRLENLSADASYTQRAGATEYLVSQFLNNPVMCFFGNGNGSSSSNLLRTTITISGFSTSDNQYTALLYDFGLYGIGLFIFAVIRAFFSCIKNKRNEFITIILPILCQLLFYNGLNWPISSTVFFIMIGMFHYEYSLLHKVSQNIYS